MNQGRSRCQTISTVQNRGESEKSKAQDKGQGKESSGCTNDTKLADSSRKQQTQAGQGADRRTRGRWRMKGPSKTA